jgi:predicted dehydrogenase
MMTPHSVGVVLAGVHGFGRQHLEEVLRLADDPGQGPSPHLVGLCDPLPPSALPEPLRTRVAAVPASDRLQPLLKEVAGPVVTIVATPIHTHVDLALTAVEHGSAVLLEKPPAPSLTSFRRLGEEARRARTPVQVGFQDVASPAAGMLTSLVAAGAIGELTGIGVSGVWSRDSAYYARSAWAGRRRMDGRDVVDGVLTNPFAHAVAAGLRAAGGRRVEDVTGIEVELYRANPIEADDTSCVRVRTVSGTTVVIAATLAASSPEEPVVTAHGSRGRIEWRYKLGEIRCLPASGPASSAPAVSTFEQPRLLANLLAHVADPRVPLLVPLEDTGAFTAVLDAVRQAPAPEPIPPSTVVDLSDGEGPRRIHRRVVPGVEDAVHRAADGLALFSETGVAWARPTGATS